MQYMLEGNKIALILSDGTFIYRIVSHLIFSSYAYIIYIFEKLKLGKYENMTKAVKTLFNKE